MKLIDRLKIDLKALFLQLRPILEPTWPSLVALNTSKTKVFLRFL